ncbi:26S proteasome non-ATPase regulatory subunit 11 [Astathelohania contejeani]|uniref:26S proteasome non-ATPase regulatory subunit 11 n=1 Tax=Astathelohania contejeani TaxID=164912 RepID=A0ABQ7HY27_9MICR|nr:26S proteasome non-ATPase regulatory subunit 11 [Thelohania contejeani]
MIENLIDVIKSSKTTLEDKEEAYSALSKHYMETNNHEELLSITYFLSTKLSNAKLVKLIKNVIFDAPSSTTLNSLLQFIDSLIEWATREKKKILGMDLEVKRIDVLLRMKAYAEVLSSISNVLPEFKNFDDKPNLIFLYVFESRAYYGTRNVSKAKSALTSARALTASTHCHQNIQAQIDLLSGMYLCDERNYVTAFSYFLEALEGFVVSRDDTYALKTAQYILLTKIITKKWDEIPVLLKNKSFMRCVSDESISIILDISDSCKSRNLKKYKDLLSKYSEWMQMDVFISEHFNYLYELLLDANIIKIVEPFSNIQISFISEKLEFEPEFIEERLRKLILDGDVNGIIDHASRSLIVYDNRKLKDDGNISLVDIWCDFVEQIS